MDIIKKVNSRKAWIQVDDRTAWLIEFTKDKTNAQMSAAGDKIKQKLDWLKEVQEKIKNMKDGPTDTK